MKSELYQAYSIREKSSSPKARQIATWSSTMGFRDRWNRMLRRSDDVSGSAGALSSTSSSSSSGSGSGSARSSSPSSSAGDSSSDLDRVPVLLTQYAAWRVTAVTTAPAKPKKEKKPKAPVKPVASTGGHAAAAPSSFTDCYNHPGERPLTETNLRHQELLSGFAMTFGRSRRASLGGMTTYSDVSPCASRRASIDAGGRFGEAEYLYNHGFGHDHGHGHPYDC